MCQQHSVMDGIGGISIWLLNGSTVHMAAINGCTRFVTAKNYTTALLPFVDKTAYTEVNPMQREHSMKFPFYALTAADYIGFLILLSPVAKAYRVNDSESWLFWALALVYFLILGINIWKSVRHRKRSWLYTGIVCVCAIELIWYTGNILERYESTRVFVQYEHC